MKRTDIIKDLVNKYKYESYLEIGVKNPAKNFDLIKINHKDGVDPNWRSDPISGNKYEMTSDEYFSKLNRTYDIIFIDGLHHHEQIDKDIKNAFKNLNANGTVVVHDSNPHKKYMQDRPRVSKEWTGDGWRSILKLRCKVPKLSIFVVDTDFGCAVIRKGTQKLYTGNINMNWNEFDRNRKSILNLKTPKEFKKWVQEN